MAHIADRGGQPQRMPQFQPSAPLPAAPTQPDDIEAIRAQLAEMQDKLDALHAKVNS